jgi:hypothetical protein
LNLLFTHNHIFLRGCLHRRPKLIKRVKHLVGYAECSAEELANDGDELVLTDVEHYAFGDVRSREDYLEWTRIDVEHKECLPIDWCNEGTEI